MQNQSFGPSGAAVRGTGFEFKASAAETASSTHNNTSTGPDGGSLYVIVAVTAASGTTPTLSVVVEGSQDGTNWFQLGVIGSNGYAVGSVVSAPANFTTTGTVRATFPRTQLVRTRSVIAGTTPSFTYSAEGSVI